MTTDRFPPGAYPQYPPDQQSQGPVRHIWDPWVAQPAVLGPVVAPTPVPGTINVTEEELTRPMDLDDMLGLIAELHERTQKAEKATQKAEKTVKKVEKPVITATDVKSFLMRNAAAIRVRPCNDLDGKLTLELVLDVGSQGKYVNRGDVLLSHVVEEDTALSFVEEVNGAAFHALTRREHKLTVEAQQLRQKLEQIEVKLRGVADARDCLTQMQGQVEAADAQNKTIKRRINL